MSIYNGENIKIMIFGQSHSQGIGVCIEGLPSGFKIDLDELYEFLQRRAPGRNSYSTKRSEPDHPEFLSGLVDGVTCGAPLAAVIYNKDTHSQDYDNLRNTPRPGHADFTAHLKYGADHDIRGGGHFSGRLTAPLCIAGGIFIQMLKRSGIEIGAHIAQISHISDEGFDPVNVSAETLIQLKSKAFHVLDEKRGQEMIAAIEAARLEGDSLGGVVECAAVGVPGGAGDPMFASLESRIAGIVFGIPAVKGIEFGNGFNAAALSGSDNNDAFYMEGDVVKTRTNNHGGILGGIASGMPVIFRTALKPTPSIAKEQDSVDLSEMKNTRLYIKGRHDPCIVPRAVPCIEAAAAIAIYDAL